MKNLLFLTILFCFSSFSQQPKIALENNGSSNLKVLYQQQMEDRSVNFYEVVKTAERYFETIDKKKKGSGYKPFQCWVVANE